MNIQLDVKGMREIEVGEIFLKRIAEIEKKIKETDPLRNYKPNPKYMLFVDKRDFYI